MKFSKFFSRFRQPFHPYVQDRNSGGNPFGALPFRPALARDGQAGAPGLDDKLQYQQSFLSSIKHQVSNIKYQVPIGIQYGINLK